MNIEKLETQEKKLEDSKINELFRSIIMGNDVTEIIHTKLGDFKVKYPRARDIAEIGRLTALRLNGISAICFDVSSYNTIKTCATLDVIVVKGPDWYELAKNRKPGFSWQDIPSQNLIAEVYAKAYEFREDVQRQIDGDKDEAIDGVVSDERSENSDQPGLFEGLSGESGSD